MRTTINLDADLLADAKQVAARSHRSLGSVLEDALRLMLASTEDTPPRDEPVSLPVHGRGGPRPGVDLANSEQVADLLGDNESARASA
jgi:plasmid stability protein